MTELGRHLVPENITFLQTRGGSGGMQFKTVEVGAATTVFAGSAPKLEGRGGLYLEDCHVAQINDDPNAAAGVRTYALDSQKAERLWTISEALVGERFPAV